MLTEAEILAIIGAVSSVVIGLFGVLSKWIESRTDAAVQKLELKKQKLEFELQREKEHVGGG